MPLLRLFLLFCCMANFFVLGAAERFFPLHAGDFWQYRSTNGQHQFRIESTLPIIDGGRVYHGIRGYVEGNRARQIREVEGVGLFVADFETSTETLLTSFNASATPTFPADFRPCGTVLGTVQPQRESLMLPSGYWQDTLRITYQSANCGEPSVVSEIYVPGIGMVQRTLRVGDEIREYNLVYARVSNQLVFAGWFSLTSLIWHPPAQNDRVLRFTILSAGGYGREARLLFDTAQRFDLVIRDANRNKIWQYSDGKTFLPGNWRIDGPAAFDVEVPLDALPGKTLPPGLYTVEAWLTTTGGNPTHATSQTLVVPDFGQPPASISAINRTESRGGVARPLPGRPMSY
jgi:hypothetical protein